MKILHAAETIKGGVATVINSLTEHQTKLNDYEVICIVPSDQSDNLLKINDLKEIQFNRNGRNITGMFSFFWVLIRTIITKKPDVLHLHSSFAGLLGRLAIVLSGRRNKTKVIYCPHAFGFLMQTSPFKKRIYGFVELFLAKFTDKIICVSQSEYDAALKKGFPQKKLALVYNGVKPKDMRNSRTLNYKQTYKILFVGRFDFQKGIDILAEAIELLALEKNNIFYEFTLIGEAVNSDDEIIFKNSDHIKIHTLGWLKPHQLEEQYLNHDAIVIPSRWEGFAMVPLEAMSYGLPIIASDISTFRELETNINQHVIFFKNKQELFEIFKEIATLDLEQRREIEEDVFKNNFSAEKMKNDALQNYF